MSSARDEILGRVRDALAGATRPTVDRAVTPPGRPALVGDAEALARAFAARAESVGARVHVVADEAEAAAVLAARLAETGATTLVHSGAALATRIAQSLPEQIERTAGGSRAQLLAADVGLTTAQLAIAETGTLVLVGTSERHRLASLLPAAHVALVRLDDLVPGLDDALARLAADGDDPAPCVTFITGPSRTADIELQLVVGVHGPRSLDVLLLRSSP